MSFDSFKRVLPLIPVSAWVISAAHATQYLSLEEAQKTIFPKATRFEVSAIKLTKEQKKEIEKLSDMRMRPDEQKVWKAYVGKELLGYFIVDEVYGKHEFITYSIGLTADGAVTQVEIMDYRETYGSEVRNPLWRKQFVGKTLKDPFVLDKDIVNISGATLSSRHITDGVKKLLAFYKVTVDEITHK